MCKLKDCGLHFFHKDCIYNQAKIESKDEFSQESDSKGEESGESGTKSSKNLMIKCCVCGQQYGTVYGDMPDGTMAW